MPSYHQDVRLFRVHDVQTDKTIGHFYIDLHPREGKYGHACVTAIKVIDLVIDIVNRLSNLHSILIKLL